MSSEGLFALCILSPVFLVLSIMVKSTSRGPVFFKQARIGLRGEPFTIYKFRSMVSDAEKDGPQLSSSNDSRITGIGKFMRKSRLDEIPQFFNVIIGDMSLVGPRPERQYFIDKIMERAPHYKHLQKVKTRNYILGASEIRIRGKRRSNDRSFEVRHHVC